MRCVVVRKKLDRYKRHELASQMREQIEAHLTQCADCRQHLARQERLATFLMSAHEPPSVPEGFCERLLVAARERQAVQRPTPVSLWRLHWLRPSVLAGRSAAQTAVLAGGILLGILMGQQTWRSAHPTNPQKTIQADPFAVYELDYLTNAPGDSLVGAYLSLTATLNHNNGT
jgi:anti-sigma factor RsiW